MRVWALATPCSRSKSRANFSRCNKACQRSPKGVPRGGLNLTSQRGPSGSRHKNLGCSPAADEPAGKLVPTCAANWSHVCARLCAASPTVPIAAPAGPSMAKAPLASRTWLTAKYNTCSSDQRSGSAGKSGRKRASSRPKKPWGCSGVKNQGKAAWVNHSCLPLRTCTRLPLR